MTDQVAATTDRALTAILAEAQRASRLPSAVAGLLRDGERVWWSARGHHTGAAAPDPALQYRIGSITKTFTAVLVLQLVRDGQVALDTGVREVLGEVGYADRTLRSLLAHSSGMQSEPVGPWWERSPGVAWEELAEANDGSGAVFPADQQFHYSNLGYAILGRVVEEIVGRPWWDCVQARILRPLDLRRTSYAPEAPAAQGYSVHPYAGTLHHEPATDTRAMAPAGQLWSTVDDLLRYARFLLEGHPEVLSSEALAEASHPQQGDHRHLLAFAQASGFMLVPGGSGVLVGHSGSMPGFVAGLLVDRGRSTAGVLLGNGTDGPAPLGVVRRLLETLEQHEPGPGAVWTPAEQVPAEIAELLGVWHWGNTPFQLRWDDGRLEARHDGESAYDFGLRDGRIVGISGYHAGETLQVHRHPDGTVSHLEIATFVYTRDPGAHPTGR